MSDSNVKWETLMDIAALSDIGMRRNSNQDNYCILQAPSLERWETRGHLFAVADGMGAHAAGELASKVAVDQIPLVFSKLSHLPPEDALRRSLQEANAEIHRRGQANDEFRNMGTTCSALLLNGDGAWAAHVGDSRVYRMRGNVLEQLTFDHSLVWEMRQAGTLSEAEEASGSRIPRNVITRSLGPYPDVNVDLEGPFDVQPGDQFLLCSDGLTGQIEDSEIGALLQVLSPHEAARVLVDLANLRGGPDNITLIVLRITSPELSAGRSGSGHGQAGNLAGRRPILAMLWTLLAVLVLAGWLLFWWSRQPMAIIGPAVLALAVLGTITGLSWKRSGPVRGEGAEGNSGPGGRGPYIQTDCRSTAWKTVDHLRELLQQIRAAAQQRKWRIDEAEFRKRLTRAEALAGSRDLRGTLREFALAVSFVMEQLRRQGAAETSLDLDRR